MTVNIEVRAGSFDTILFSEWRHE